MTHSKTSQSVLLTGATGFVGSHAARRLLQEGYQVTCLVRPTSNLRFLQGLELDIQVSDMDRVESLQPLLENQHLVVHLAGAVKAKDQADFYAVNLGLTKRLLHAAISAKNGPRRFVFLSSLAAAGPCGPRAQRTGLAGRPVSTYGWSKRAAERLLIQHRNDIEVVILRPTAVYGPRDRAMLPAFRTATAGLALEPAGAKQRVSFCHVEDLAQALHLAASRPLSSGHILPIASTPNVTMDEFARTLLHSVQKALGRNRSGLALPLPATVLRSLGLVAGSLSRALGRAPMLDADKALELTAGDWVVDPKPAERFLGFSPSWSLAHGLEQTAGWYKKEGWL